MLLIAAIVATVLFFIFLCVGIIEDWYEDFSIIGTIFFFLIAFGLWILIIVDQNEDDRPINPPHAQDGEITEPIDIDEGMPNGASFNTNTDPRFKRVIVDGMDCILFVDSVGDPGYGPSRQAGLTCDWPDQNAEVPVTTEPD